MMEQERGRGSGIINVVVLNSQARSDAGVSGWPKALARGIKKGSSVSREPCD